ncbi:MAG: hypothetical protein RLZZ500_2454 [Bacteroidota bacterium]|jgi:hypothetical protein
MKNSKPTYDFKLIIVSAILVVVLAAAFFFYWETTKVLIRIVLESKFTYFLIWTVTILIFIIHYLRHKDKEVKSETIITKKFGVFMDNALGGFTYATIITTCLTLLKGLYIQKFFIDKVYFLEFNDMDLMTVFGVMIFLLWYAGVKVIDTAKETYKVQHTEVVMTEDKKVVIPTDNDEEITTNKLPKRQ